MNIYRNRCIARSTTLIGAMKKMDALDKKLLIIVENDVFFGVISAGDIQRAILQNVQLNSTVESIVRKNLKFARPEDTFESVKELMFDYRMEFCPVVSETGYVTNVFFWEDIFEKKKIEPRVKMKVPVVIMAGGFGTRLKPLTNILPKPLIPIGEQTMLEEIIAKFSFFGSTDFFISVNYKADLIEFYINRLGLPYDINYVREEKPFGTAGSLSLLKNTLKETFFVHNCDILIDQDYTEIYNYHKENNNEITIVAALKHFSIPYGTLESTNGGELVALKEKPDMNFWINTGMYVLEPGLLNEIPEKEFYHITDLIDHLKLQNRKVGVFPVSEGSWLDTGEWDEYKKTQKKLYGNSF